MRPPTQKRWRKRPFLLLELLLALTLVALLFFPLIRPHLHIQKEAKKELRFQQLTKEADLYFMNFKEQLYENILPWDQLYKGEETQLNTEEEDSYVIIRTISRVDKKHSLGHAYLLIDVTFTFILKNDPTKKIPFTYSFFLEKRGSN